MAIVRLASRHTHGNLENGLNDPGGTTRLRIWSLGKMEEARQVRVRFTTIINFRRGVTRVASHVQERRERLHQDRLELQRRPTMATRWLTERLKSFISPSPSELNPSLKRKRSPAPKLSSFHNPIILDSHEEDEIIEDSEDERQEELARRTYFTFLASITIEYGCSQGLLRTLGRLDHGLRVQPVVCFSHLPHGIRH